MSALAEFLPELPVDLFPQVYINQHPNQEKSGKRKSTCALLTFCVILVIYASYLGTAKSEIIVVEPSTYTSGSRALFPYADYKVIKDKTGIKCPCSSASVAMKDLLTKTPLSPSQANGMTGIMVDLPRDTICATGTTTHTQCGPSASACATEPYTILGALKGICSYSRSIVLKLVKMFQKEQLFLPTLLSEEDLDRYMYARGSTLMAQAGMTLQTPLDAISGVYAMDRPQMNWFVSKGGYGSGGVPTGDSLENMIKVSNQGPSSNQVFFTPTATIPYGDSITGIGECNCAQDWECRRQVTFPIGSVLKAAHSNDPLFSLAYATGKDQYTNSVGWDASDNKFKFNWYCSMFDTIKNIPMEVFKSTLFWKMMKTTGADPSPLTSKYNSIAEAIEYGFLKPVVGEPQQWGSQMTDANREKFSGLLYSHEKLYNQCKPTHCSYAEERTRSGTEVIMLLVGLAGSLWLMAAGLGPMIYDKALEDTRSVHEQRNKILEKVLGEPDDIEQVVVEAAISPQAAAYVAAPDMVDCDPAQA